MNIYYVLLCFSLRRPKTPLFTIKIKLFLIVFKQQLNMKVA